MTHATDLLTTERTKMTKYLDEARERRREYQEGLNAIDEQIREYEAAIASYNGAIERLTYRADS